MFEDACQILFVYSGRFGPKPVLLALFVFSQVLISEFQETVHNFTIDPRWMLEYPRVFKDAISKC